MNKEEILNAVRILAQSQGSYGQLLKQLEYDEQSLNFLEEQQFKDVTDMVMFLEC